MAKIGRTERINECFLGVGKSTQWSSSKRESSHACLLCYSTKVKLQRYNNMEQTTLVEDFILPEVELNEIDNYHRIPEVKAWFVCSVKNAKKAAKDGLPVIRTHVGNWYGRLS